MVRFENVLFLCLLFHRLRVVKCSGCLRSPYCIEKAVCLKSRAHKCCDPDDCWLDHISCNYLMADITSSFKLFLYIIYTTCVGEMMNKEASVYVAMNIFSSRKLCRVKRIYSKLTGHFCIYSGNIEPLAKNYIFTVHRNWLAITYSLPLSEWYKEDTSQWTLDYPPLFAWFEFLLSRIAVLVEPEMLQISSSPYVSTGAVIFQRSTVIATDLLYICSSFLMSRRSKAPQLIFSLLCFNAGLFLVDSVHFQYNSLLFALLLLSVNLMIEGKVICGFALFIVLLHLKHLFLCLLPSYAAYIFGVYLWPKRYDCYGRIVFCLRTFLIGCAKLGAVAMFISALSLGPFVCLGQGKLLLARLFPFKRGLTHAYWAPNFWALYNFVDYCLYAVGTHRGFISRRYRPEYTSGMVKSFKHIVLPSVTPLTAFACTVAGMLPFCAAVAWKPSRVSFVKVMTACAFLSFLFGWHVHEKAVLTIIIPLTLLAIEDERYARIFLIVSILGHYSLFPLLFKPMEIFVKYSVLILSCAFSYGALKSTFHRSLNKPVYFLNRFDQMCVAGVVPIEIFYIVTSVFPRFNPFPFLPLMTASVYCAIGLCYCFALYCWAFFSDAFLA